ncbi:nucleotidyltransferase family protein [Magnetospirillum moscoviense]|uniref:Polymerase nucleotidyl transferase domain-containing protein n=1 Tax=Magnetospirillum moscoviense TaxID=1437059 RepID=A0A178M9M7_9PROT|nr:nucleotidyltransferase domain-containing protein [Magnetospirillum moscoviense]OAN44907.1 hypothetical protein A6A05_17315 [Magnetospirillum moscoviense]
MSLVIAPGKIEDVMATVSSVPDQLLNQVVSVFHPRRVILFGSRARGDARLDSDIDLVVELDNDAPPEMMSAKVIHSARAGYHEPVDILPCREGVLKERARAIGSFAHTVLTEGVVVYERP